MHFRLAILLLLFGATGYVKAQEEAYLTLSQVPEKVIQKYKLLFPADDIGNVLWEFEDNGYEGYLHDSNREKTGVVFFNAEGKLLYKVMTTREGIRTGSENEIEMQEIPGELLDYVKKKHSEKKIKAAIKHMDAEEAVTAYVVILDGLAVELNNISQTIGSYTLP
ncbi:MAG TPA: hypothetical protein VD905_14920 [Flavobacteriales bacterium]|nr:hypothetical protein [Flavobacteriales bacterium]